MPVNRLRHLDAVRGVAAIAVVAQHSLEHVGIGAEHNLNLGRFGVVLFFLLSGFVIPFSFSGDQPLKRFFVTRFFRLYPAYWVSLIAAAAVAAISPVILIVNVTMLQRAFAVPDAVPTYWSLFYELIFYGICVGLFRVGMPTRVIGCLAIVFVFASVSYVGTMFLAFMLAGTLVRQAWWEKHALAQPWAVVVLLLLVTRSAFLFVSSGEFDVGYATGALLAIPVFLAAVWFRPRSDFAEWLGKISYSLYLLHFVIIMALPPMWGPAYFCAVVVLSLAGSALSFRYVEAPAMRLGKRIKYAPSPPMRASSSLPRCVPELKSRSSR